MSPILDLNDVSNLIENYPFDTKLDQLLFLLDNNLIKKEDIIFPFVFSIYKWQLLVYGIFSKSIFEINKSQIIMHVNGIRVSKDTNIDPIKCDNFKCGLKHFKFNKQIQTLFNILTDKNDSNYEFIFKIDNIYFINDILNKYIATLNRNDNIIIRYIDNKITSQNYVSEYHLLNKLLFPEMKVILNKLNILTTEIFCDKDENYKLKFRRMFDIQKDKNVSDDEWDALYNYLIEFNLLTIKNNKNDIKLKLEPSLIFNIEYNLYIGFDKLNTDLNNNIKTILYKPINDINKFVNINYDGLIKLIKLYNTLFSTNKTRILLSYTDILKINNLSKIIQNLDEKLFVITKDEWAEFSQIQDKFFNLFYNTIGKRLEPNSEFDFGEFKWKIHKRGISTISIKSTLPCLTLNREIKYAHFIEHMKLLKIFGKLDIFYDQFSEFILLYS